MSESVQFETPEHVTVSYKLAGLGTRFFAWVYDMLVVLVSQIIIGFALLFVGVVFDVPFFNSRGGGMSTGVMFGFVIVIAGFLPIVYFMLCEHFLNGQTIGKRSAQIRVVMAEGFSLSFTSVILRNVFRLIDTIPLLWSVPFLTKRYQRFGDMVAGTLVVNEPPPKLDSVSMRLLARDPASNTFAFTTAQLAVVTEKEFETLEVFLDRRGSAQSFQTNPLTTRMVNAFASRMSYYPLPTPEQNVLFLEELLGAHLRRRVGGLK